MSGKSRKVTQMHPITWFKARSSFIQFSLSAVGVLLFIGVIFGGSFYAYNWWNKPAEATVANDISQVSVSKLGDNIHSMRLKLEGLTASETTTRGMASENAAKLKETNQRLDKLGEKLNPEEIAALRSDLDALKGAVDRLEESRKIDSGLLRRLDADFKALEDLAPAIKALNEKVSGLEIQNKTAGEKLAALTALVSSSLDMSAKAGEIPVARDPLKKTPRSEVVPEAPLPPSAKAPQAQAQNEPKPAPAQQPCTAPNTVWVPVLKGCAVRMK